MTRMIQIRNVPDGLHRRLKAMAALEGRSLSDFLLDELRRTGERPTLEELRRRISARGGVQLSAPAADAVRAEREEREESGRARPPRRRRAG